MEIRSNTVDLFSSRNEKKCLHFLVEKEGAFLLFCIFNLVLVFLTVNSGWIPDVFSFNYMDFHKSINSSNGKDCLLLFYHFLTAINLWSLNSALLMYLKSHFDVVVILK